MKMGRVCLKHPALNGVRYRSGNCPACMKEWQRALPPERVEARRASRRAWYRRNQETVRAKQRRYAAANPDRVRAAAKRRYAEHGGAIREQARWRGKRRFGLSRAQFDALLSAQGGGCAICHTALPESRGCVDHCHTTGRIRGILCAPCNTALGFFRDDPQRLRAAATYLEEN